MNIILAISVNYLYYMGYVAVVRRSKQEGYTWTRSDPSSKVSLRCGWYYLWWEPRDAAGHFS